MKKILFIDTWTHADRFINPLIKSLSNDGHLCVLLHCDSLFLNSRYTELKPIKNTLYESIDLNKFGYSFYKAILSIKPDKVIYISIHGIIQRWANMITSDKKIKSIFFMHGIRENNPPKVKSSILYKLKRVIFYSKIFYYLNADFFRISRLNIYNFKFMLYYYLELIFKNYQYSNQPKINLGFDYNYMFVNNKKDIKYFKNNYPISKKTEFIISGNVSALTPALKSLNHTSNKNVLLFISQTEIYDAKTLNNVLIKLLDMSKFLKLKLVFRPHPRDINNIKIAKRLDIEVSNLSEELDYARTKIAAGINSAMMIGFFYLGNHIVQIKHGHNLNISEEFNYKNITELDTSNINSFYFEKKLAYYTNNLKSKIKSPIETIKKIVIDD